MRGVLAPGPDPLRARRIATTGAAREPAEPTTALLKRSGKRRDWIGSVSVLGPGQDHDRGGRAHAQRDLLRHVHKLDADGHSLGEADPLEGRGDLRQQLPAGRAVVGRDTPAERDRRLTPGGRRVRASS
jgi:hypothetical protein